MCSYGGFSSGADVHRKTISIIIYILRCECCVLWRHHRDLTRSWNKLIHKNDLITSSSKWFNNLKGETREDAYKFSGSHQVGNRKALWVSRGRRGRFILFFYDLIFVILADRTLAPVLWLLAFCREVAVHMCSSSPALIGTERRSPFKALLRGSLVGLSEV